MSSLEKLKLIGEAVNELLKNQNVIAEEASVAGHAEGRKSGLKDGKEIGIEEGKALGHEDGRCVGLESGKKLGYQSGYDQGLIDGKSLIIDEFKALEASSSEQINSLNSKILELEAQANPGKKYSQDELDLAVSVVQKQADEVKAELEYLKNGLQAKIDSSRAEAAIDAVEKHKEVVAAEELAAQSKDELSQNFN